MSNSTLTPSIFLPLARAYVRPSIFPRHSLLLSCPQCRSPLTPNHQPPLLPNPRRQHKPFTTTPHPLKKQGGKKASKRTVSLNAEKTADDDPSDPSNFSALEAEIETIVTGLREQVRKIRPGGVSAEAVEEVRVALRKGGGGGGSSSSAADKGSKEVVKVGELAQVVPKGRVMVLFVAEKEVRAPTLNFPPLFSKFHAQNRKEKGWNYGGPPIPTDNYARPILIPFLRITSTSNP